MNVTYILRNLTDSCLADLADMDTQSRGERLQRLAADLPHCVTCKVGNGSFGDRVTLNRVIGGGKPYPCNTEFKIERRRGYLLVTFTFPDI